MPALNTSRAEPVTSLAVIPVIIEQYESLDQKLDQLLIEIEQLRAEVKRPWWKRW